MSTISLIPPSVKSYVYDFDARARRAAVALGLGRALAAFLFWALVCCLADRYAHLGPAARLALLAAGIVVAGIPLLRPLRRILRREVDWLAAAALVEAHNPSFGQRLVTVISRVLGPPEHRGSDAMLRALLRDVDRQAAAERRAHPLPIATLLAPWAAAAFALTLAGALTRVPDFDLPRLAQRFVLPLADIDPVTTTQVRVLTGDRDVVQSEPLTVEAEVRNLDGADVVSLYLSDDEQGTRWTRATMAPSPDGGAGDRFTFTIASVDRDRTYYVWAGDATSRHYAVRVLRRPAAAEFRVRYVYPAHTGLPPLTVSNADGVVEAPAGTEATLTVTATEPLRSAELTFAGERIPMEQAAAGDAQRLQRQAKFVVRKDGPLRLEMVSTRGVAGAGPAAMRVRAIPDLRPLVRLAQPSTGLRLNPRDIVPLPYQALDDYGIESLSVRAQVNGSDEEGATAAAPIVGDPRRQEGVYNFDLAAMRLAVGDVVTITVAARDRAGHTAASEPLQILVSPRSVDMATYRRIAELSAAADLADGLAEQLASASAAADEADAGQRDSLAYAAALGRGNRQLTAAAESATLLRQSLLRTAVQSDAPALSAALAGWVDAAQVMGFAAEDFFRRNAAPDGMGAEARDALRRARDLGERVRREVRTVADGQRAAALLADLENRKETQKKLDGAEKLAETDRTARPRVERLRKTLQRSRQEIAAGVRRLGLDPREADLDQRLRATVAAAEAVTRSARPADFAADARAWADQLRRESPARPTSLDERLSAAAQVEAVRPDADLTRAHDLKQAARAAARLEKLASDPTTAKDLFAGEDLDDFAAAVATLQREHQTVRGDGPDQARLAPATNPSQRAADDARLTLARLAGDATVAATPPQPQAPEAQRAEAEDVALRAGAASASRDYEKTRALDRSLFGRLLDLAKGAAPTTAPSNPAGAVASAEQARIEGNFRRVGQAVDRAERIDHIATDQEKIAGETQAAAGAESATAPLAERQQGVAEAIARAKPGRADEPAGNGSAAPPATSSPWEDPNWRDRATAAVVAAQEQFAAMPHALAKAQEALAAQRELLGRAEAARREAEQAAQDGAMGAERQDAARRAAEQAAQDAEEAAGRARAALAPVDAAAVESLAGRLRTFAPETSGSVMAIEQLLAPALRELRRAAAEGGDPSAADRAADEARRAIEAVQRELAHAQQAFVERDPLVAAKWFARAAADSLAQQPPDLSGARRLQRDTSQALSRAWDQSIHEAAAYRLASLPSLRSLYAPPGTGGEGSTVAEGAPLGGTNQAPGLMSFLSNAPSVRDWSRLRPRPPQELNASMRELDPPGFEEPLRLYFEALGKGENPDGERGQEPTKK